MAQSKLDDIRQFLSRYGIEKKAVAQRMDMPYTTFYNKIDPQQLQCQFRPDEEYKLLVVLHDMRTEIDNILTMHK